MKVAKVRKRAQADSNFEIKMHPDTRWTCRVMVYKLKRTMLAAHKRANGGTIGAAFEAICEGYTRQGMVGRGWSRMPDICTLRFHRGSLKLGIIAHECTHAALRWYEAETGRTTLPLKSDTHDVSQDEERVAWVAGRMMAEVTMACANHIRKTEKTCLTAGVENA